MLSMKPGYGPTVSVCGRLYDPKI